MVESLLETGFLRAISSATIIGGISLVGKNILFCHSERSGESPLVCDRREIPRFARNDERPNLSNVVTCVPNKVKSASNVANRALSDAFHANCFAASLCVLG